jgi:hypothetical protein
MQDNRAGRLGRGRVAGPPPVSMVLAVPDTPLSIVADAGHEGTEGGGDGRRRQCSLQTTGSVMISRACFQYAFRLIFAGDKVNNITSPTSQRSLPFQTVPIILLGEIDIKSKR